MRFWIVAVLAVLFAMPVTPEEAKPEPPIDVMEILINGHIADSDAVLVASSVATAQTRKAKSIRILINSPGGHVVAGLNIIAELQKVKIPIVCEVISQANSLAAVIFESKVCQKRIVRPYSLIMFHEASYEGASILRTPEVEQIAAGLRAHNRAIAAIVAPRLGLSIDEYEARVRNREWWVAGVDAIEQGVADEIKE